jgi:hypothetical protein
MNIVKLQDDLKGVPDQSLIGYVQNPTGQVPSYLALSELNRRKKMREQASSNQAEGPQPSVAEQLVAEAQPQPQPQGIAGIPVANVGNEEAYASGGIVSFETGGMPYLRPTTPYLDETKRRRGLSSSEAYWLEMDRAEKEREVAYAKIQDAILGTTGTPSSWRYAITGGHLGSPYKPATPGAEANYQKQLETQADKINRAKYPASTESMIPAKRNLGGGPAYYSLDPSLPSFTGGPQDPRQFSYVQNPTTQDSMVPETNKPGVDTGTNRDTTKSNKQTSSNIQQGIKQLLPAVKGLEFDPVKDLSSEFEISPNVDARDAMQRYKDLVGVNPFQAKAAEKLAAMEANNAKFSEQMPWMSLAEAGLAMAAGQSPNALSNIAEGGMKGVTAYKAGQDKIRSIEDKIFDAQAKVAEAQRAEDIAAAKHGVDSEEAAKAARRVEKAKLFEYKTELAATNAAGKMDIEKFNTTAALRREELEMTERNATARIKMQLKAAEKRATTEDQKLEIASLRSAVTSAQTNVVSARKAYGDLVKGMAEPQDIADAKADLDSALADLKYYQGLANQNISNDTLPKLSAKAQAFLNN